ncbi:MAG: radical SAM protein [Chloroflexi bacterium]|nr:radical SAM protein [Chloroflexota bacterium]
MTKPVLLVNTNVSQPPVSPVGLEYTGEALVEAGIPVRVLDLAFEADWKAALANELKNYEPLAVGLAVRNTDDCCFATRKSFLPWIEEVVTEVRRLTQAFIILGGGGFSVMPEAILRFTRADAGIIGDSEEAVVTLVKCLQKDGDIAHLSNIVHWHKGKIAHNRRTDVDLERLPVPRRRLFDNKRYETQGAMVGIETKRGCSQKCIFCADPVAKGSRVRLRPPHIVVQEFRDLFEQGVSWFHLGDSEFNLPIAHAKAVCTAIIEADLGEKIRWYTYCSPTPFDHELATLMKRAGCAGINFGVDSLCGEQLHRLDRSHSISDIRELARILKEAEINYIFDLLMGGPGETEETVKETIGKVREFNTPLIGIALGVRVYPETTLGKAVSDGLITEGLVPGKGCALHEPLFYLSPALGSNAPALITELVAGDPRFLFLMSPSEAGSYNYAGDEALCQLIKDGARGAYWDILGRSKH